LEAIRKANAASIPLAWMDEDTYAFSYQIENDAAAAFDEPGLAAFEKAGPRTLDASAAPSNWTWWRRAEILRVIYVAQ
jgi:hypothetical protein